MLTGVEEPYITADLLRRRARRGLRLLLGRQVILQVLTFGGGVILARILAPAQFGLYAIAGFLVGVFSLLGDCGLAPSLIQRRTEITDRDLQVAFTVQQGLITGVVFMLLLGAPWLAALYPHAPPETAWLVRALAFNLYLTSWRSMSALQLERHLRYDRLARVDVAEALSFQGLAVVLALAGWGVWSFVWASLARGLLGTALLYAAAPWPARLVFDRRIARDLLRMGLPFQAQHIIHTIGNSLTPALVGTLIGPHAVGLLTWASSNGGKPLILADNAVRVAFPHFARLQEDRAELERVLIRYLSYLLAAAGFWLALLLAAGQPVVHWIYTAKWTPGVPALILYAAALGLHVPVWMMGTALNSTGRVRLNTRLVTGRTLAQVGLGVPLVLLLGFNGVPVALLLVEALVLPWMACLLSEGNPGRLLLPMGWVLAPVGIGALTGRLVSLLPLPLALRALGAALAVSLAYGGAAWLVAPGWIRETARGHLGRYLPVRKTA